MRTLARPEDRSQILDRLAAVDPDRGAVWGRMTAPQMICHLRDSYLVALGERQASAATGILQRTVVKWAGLWAPMQWPKGLSTRPELEPGSGGTPPGAFEEDRRLLIGTIDRFSRVPSDFSWPPHPIFGPMRARDWMRWGYLHADHHLRQFGV